MTEPDPWLTDEQAARLVNREPSTIKTWRRRGLIRSHLRYDVVKRREVYKTLESRILDADGEVRRRMYSGKGHAD